MTKKSKKSTKSTKSAASTKRAGKPDPIMERFRQAAAASPKAAPVASPASGAAEAQPVPATSTTEPVPTAGATATAAGESASPAPGTASDPSDPPDASDPAVSSVSSLSNPSGKRLSLVSAAILVLDATGNQPLSCPELVKQATARGLWHPLAGKTPASTLYAAILREIKDKPEKSRFKKTDRGKFVLTTPVQAS